MPLACCVIHGCIGQGAGFETVTKLPEEPRRPPGIAVEPRPRHPLVARQASSEDLVFALEAPPGLAEIRDLIRSFFTAVLNESLSSLEEVVSVSAGFRTLPGANRVNARQSWQLRFAHLDYGKMTSPSVYRDRDLTLYRAGFSAGVHGAGPPLPLTPTGTQLVAHVAVRHPRAGPSRLFGDDVWFLLNPEQKGYMIAEIIEDFSLP